MILYRRDGILARSFLNFSEIFYSLSEISVCAWVDMPDKCAAFLSGVTTISGIHTVLLLFYQVNDSGFIECVAQMRFCRFCGVPEWLWIWKVFWECSQAICQNCETLFPARQKGQDRQSVLVTDSSSVSSVVFKKYLVWCFVEIVSCSMNDKSTPVKYQSGCFTRPFK